MRFPFSLFHPFSLSLVTTEASKKLGWVTTSIRHLSFWQLWFPGETDRSHSLFCFEIVSSHFLKMAGLLLINPSRDCITGSHVKWCFLPRTYVLCELPSSSWWVLSRTQLQRLPREEQGLDSSCLPSLLLLPWNSGSINTGRREATSKNARVPSRRMSSCTQRKAWLIHHVCQTCPGNEKQDKISFKVSQHSQQRNLST